MIPVVEPLLFYWSVRPYGLFKHFLLYLHFIYTFLNNYGILSMLNACGPLALVF